MIAEKQNDASVEVENDSREKEEELIAEAVIVPPDGGWGWIVVIASFLTNAVVDGLIFTVGQGFLPKWEKEFTHGHAGPAAWVVSLLSGCYLLVGPIVSSVANIFGCRLTAIIGTVLACCGFVASTFAQNIWFLYCSFGILGGIGLGFVYLPSIVIVSYYFEKRRALATGIAVCGSGIGTFSFAPLIKFLLTKYTWQTTVLIITLIVLHCIVFAIFYRPLTPSNQQITKLEEHLYDYDESREMKQLNNRKSIMQNNDNGGVWDESVKKNGNGVQDDIDISDVIRPLSHHFEQKTMSNCRKNEERAEEKNPFLDKNVKFERFEQYLNQAKMKRRAVSTGQRIFRSTMDLSSHRKLTYPSISKCHATKPAPGNVSTPLGSSKALAVPAHEHPIHARELYKAVSRRSFALLNRPLSRMDIFYSGSVRHLPQFKSQPDVRHFLASTLSIPAMVRQDSLDIRRQFQATTTTVAGQLAPTPVIDESSSKGLEVALKSMLDFSLFSSPTFLMLAFSGFFTLTGFFVPFIYLPKMAVEYGHTPERAVLLVSLLGITNIVARIFCGWLSDRPQTNSLMINNWALIFAGIATVLVPHFKAYWLFCLYCVVFGTGTACFASLRSVICVDLLGLEKLTNAYGLLLLFMGIASLIGTPLAGFLFDQTNSYYLSFYVMGAMVTFSGVLGLPLPKVNAWEKAKEKKRAKLFDASHLDEEKTEYENQNEISFSTQQNTKKFTPKIVINKPTNSGDPASIVLTETLNEEEEVVS